jgi:hypothetical protein
MLLVSAIAFLVLAFIWGVVLVVMDGSNDAPAEKFVQTPWIRTTLFPLGIAAILFICWCL